VPSIIGYLYLLQIPLRRMVYLVLKELTPISNDVIIVMSSLTKDMNSKTELYRANAIRVLCGITDVRLLTLNSKLTCLQTTMLTQVERYLKQSIVDKDPYVASAALVSGSHLMRTSPEVVSIFLQNE
jgi:coatomer protein complex subunit gamma